MDTLTHPKTLSFKCTAAQKTAMLRGVPADATVGEVVRGFLKETGFPENDVQGRPLNYKMRRESDGKQLFDTETVGDTITEGEPVYVAPELTAG